MDSRLHFLQGKAEGVKHPELQQLLTEFAADRLALLQRHEAGARAVGHYDFNNTYQYIIAREETHLTWLQTALAEFGAALPPPANTLPVPGNPKPGKKADPSADRTVLDDDARHLGAFVERWTPRVEAVTHARHRNMLRVILGESLEHTRLFEQASAGMEDLLGRRTGGVPRTGAVLSTRWVE
jgi:hypothetical protein